MEKHTIEPVRLRILNNLREITELSDFSLANGLYASSDGHYSMNDHPERICIAIDFNFTVPNMKETDGIEIMLIEANKKGYGTKLVDCVMKEISSDKAVYVHDASEGESKKFWPKMIKKYPNIHLY